MTRKIGGQPGNNNATKNKPITDELMKVLKEETTHRGQRTIKLRKLVSVWVDNALDGDRAATKEIVNRIEGTPVQVFESDVDGAGLVVNILKFTDNAAKGNVIDHEPAPGDTENAVSNDIKGLTRNDTNPATTTTHNSGNNA